MTTVYAKDYNILPEHDISEELSRLLSYVGELSGEKNVVFAEGTYYLDSEKCAKKMLYITNTVGDSEFESGETPHLNTVGFYLNGISDLVIDGGNSVFIIDGKLTNIAIENCKNITLKNLELRHAHPDMHELKVVGKTAFGVDFEIDRDTLCEYENGKLYFCGKDYKSAADRDSDTASWIGLIRSDSPDKVKRVRHPLFSARKIQGLGERKIRVGYPNTSRFKLGDRFYIYDVRRQFAGIFINRSENIILDNIKQRFNYSLALVVQDSENITADRLDFSPKKDSARKLASVADFVQLCMCRGKVRITNSNFCGAGDDCLNIHGIHFKITEKRGNDIIVRFMHPQTHGFNPLRAGDSIAFIDTKTLLERGHAEIINSVLLNEYEIRLTLDSADKAVIGEVIEDVTACPELEFKANTLSRIITRGLLITTRGRVTVEDNHFVCTTMSGILLSDDAENWFESGMCLDVTVGNNVFDYCGQTPILIKPENRKYKGAVHRNIKIISNEFKSYKGVCIKAESTDGILIKDNSFIDKKHLKAKNCNDITL